MTVEMLLHAADNSARLDLHVVLPLSILAVVALAAIWAPAPSAVAGFRDRAQLPRPSLLWPVVGAWILPSSRRCPAARMVCITAR